MFSLQKTVSTCVQLLLQLSTSLLTACRLSGRLDVALQRSQARSKCKFRIASGWMGHDRHEVLFLRLSNNRRSKRDTRLFTSMSSVPHYCEKASHSTRTADGQVLCKARSNGFPSPAGLVTRYSCVPWVKISWNKSRNWQTAIEWIRFVFVFISRAL